MKHVISFNHKEEVEKIKLLLKKKLLRYALTQASYDGKRSELITESEFKVLCIDVLKMKGQLASDEIKKVLQTESFLFNIKEAEEIANRQKKDLQKQINIEEHKKNDLSLEKENLPQQNNWKGKIQKWLFPLTIFFSTIDTLISYSSFKVAYAFLIASIMALGAGVVVISSHWVSNWINRIKDKVKRRRYVLVTLLSALIFFTGIASVRAQSLNSAVSISVSENPAPPKASMVPFIIISTALFSASFIVSLISLKTPEEAELDRKHTDLDTQIGELTTSQAALLKELKELPGKIAQQKADARTIFYYLQNSIKESKSIARAALIEYKKVFAQVRGMVPEFFSRYNDIDIDESFIPHHTIMEQ